MESSVRSRTRSLLRRRRHDPADPEATITGAARLGKRTKELVRRLDAPDIAIIDHEDLDRIAAEDLVATRVRAVINVAPFSTGRYPNGGPLTLAQAGVRLIEAAGAALFDELRDGDVIAISGGDVRRNGTMLTSGRVLSVAALAEQLTEHRHRIDAALADFAENTVTHLRDEGALLAGGIDVPRTRTKFRDRHVLIVVRGSTYRKDLRALAPYIRGVRPLLVGVDGGSDALLEAGWKPDVVLGDMDSASDEALRSGAELIVHAYPDGRAPGADRLERMDLDHKVVRSVGTSQDVAMLLAHEKGAGLIVSVGAHFNLVEFLERSRAGMSSTFLTRLRVGELLVDAKGVSRLYNPGVTGRQLALFFVAALVLLTIVIVNTPALTDLFDLVWLKLKIILGI
ncbi:MAG: hypothetical protein E6G49_02945 [Actinobacteria bacterium]|nr:MAG: hypothetical protein E6G49_02945 [Actinomycetota bacterium]